MPEINPLDLEKVEQNIAMEAPERDQSREVPVWEHPDAPLGSTEESLLVMERGIPVRVSGPTHYHHLSDGRILGGYGIGTHVAEPNPNGGPDKVTPIIGIYGG